MRFETHCHSIYSPDSLNSLQGLIAEAAKKNIDRLAITDHNTIAGALLAKEMDPERIIIGEEILTSKGELLVFFVKQEVPRGLSPMKAIELLREQDAFISVSHPFDRLRHGWDLRDLIGIIPFIDAIEVFNARSFTKGVNEKAASFAQAHDLAGTAGSDAHTLREVGQATIILPDFTDASSLRANIHLARVEGNYSSPMVRLASTYAKWVKRMGFKK
ncbi:MAG: hypothetical protein BGO78_04375 [Chloroflexi bacterium 44-23]|nr:MAG: hypothetical protein BGO78_04375 [Chloroflexi bacterium 44-23]